MANRKPRGRETVWDMVLSMAAVGATVVVIMLIAWRPQQEVSQSVDYPAAVSSALISQTWPISVPSEIPSGYRATSARFEPETYGDSGDVRWFVGFQTESGEYVSLWQSDGPTKKVVAAATNSAPCDSSEVISGTTWQKCEIAKPLTRALVKTQGDVTTVVSGTVQWEELSRFAQSLEPAKP
jgi:hypothetical protein